jgi:hypothetical protein
LKDQQALKDNLLGVREQETYQKDEDNQQLNLKIFTLKISN